MAPHLCVCDRRKETRGHLFGAKSFRVKMEHLTSSTLQCDNYSNHCKVTVFQLSRFFCPNEIYSKDDTTAGLSLDMANLTTHV